MALAPTIDFDREYRFSDGVTPLNADTFNNRLLSIHQRITRTEGIAYSFEAIATEVANLGISRINALILPLIAQANAELANISAAKLEADQKLEELSSAHLPAHSVSLDDLRTVEDVILALEASVEGIETTIAALNAAIEALPGAATKAEAETGIDNTKMMTPLRTAEAIAARAQIGAATLMKYGAL